MQVPEAVIERMASRLEPPNTAEFPWERAATVRPDTGDNPQRVWEWVRGLWGTAPPTAPTAEELVEKVRVEQPYSSSVSRVTRSRWFPRRATADGRRIDYGVAAMSEATESDGREQEVAPPMPPV